MPAPKHRPVPKLHFSHRQKAQCRLLAEVKMVSVLLQLSSTRFLPCTRRDGTHNYSAVSDILHWKYVAMESAGQECAATTTHSGRSSPQLLLIFAGPLLPSPSRLKIDLALKWSIRNPSFLPIPPWGTETFHKKTYRASHVHPDITSPVSNSSLRTCLEKEIPPAPF